MAHRQKCMPAHRQTDILQCNKGEVELFWQMKVTHSSIPSFSLSLSILRTTNSQPQPYPTRLSPYSFLPLSFPYSPFIFSSSELLTHSLHFVPQCWVAHTFRWASGEL